jgi:hypothetical protein
MPGRGSLDQGHLQFLCHRQFLVNCNGCLNLKSVLNLRLYFPGGWFTLAARMSTQSQLQFLIDWIGLPALLLLACVLIYRKWYREFPFFFAYVIGAESVGLIRLIFRQAPTRLYSNIYWISDAALIAFAFLATYELFFKRLFPGFYKTRVYRYIFPAIAILIVVAVALIALLGGRSTVLPMTSRIYEFLRATILFFFVAFMLIMGRQWDRQEFGVAFGFALDVSTSLALIGIWTHTANRNAMLSRLAVIAYDIACIVWLYCFWPPSTPRPLMPLKPGTTDVLQEAKEWEGALKDYLTPGKHSK